MPAMFRRAFSASQNRRSRRPLLLLDNLESRVLLSGNTYSLVTLHSFGGGPVDGANPYGALVADSFGDIFSTTQSGGVNGDGSIFEFPAGSSTEQLSYSFGGTPDGAAPNAGLVFDSSGDMFGTTAEGGASNDGTIFEVLAGSTSASVIYSFTGGADGAAPAGNLIIDSAGDLFGVTTTGADGGGTAFVVPQGATTPINLHTFAGGSDGAESFSGLTLDGNGNLYGTTFLGGAHHDGTVFEISSSGQYSILAAFNGTNGNRPTGKLVVDGAGDIFGTTDSGGTHNDGTVFEFFGSNHTFASLYSFAGGAGGKEPISGMVLDGSGNLFGTTFLGGAHGDGMVFEIPDDSATPHMIASFSGGNGARPYGNLFLDGQGDVLGTTVVGGTNGFGTVFGLVPTQTTQLAFNPGPSPVQAGKSITPAITVDLEKSGGGTNINDDSFVTLSIVTGPQGGTLLGTTTVQANDGVATFTGLHLPKTGTYSIEADVGSLTPINSGDFNVLPGPPAKLAITEQPGNVVAGQTLGTITVDIDDAEGNLVYTDNTSTLTIGIAGGPKNSALMGTMTAVATAGVVTFTGLDLETAGKYSLSIAMTGVHTSNTKAFIVSPDTFSSQLKILQSPALTAVVGKALAPKLVVEVVDQFGNVVTSNHDQITLSIASQTAAGTLTGHTVVPATHGKAIFSGIALSMAGTYTLQVADPLLAINTPVPITGEVIGQGVTTIPLPHTAHGYTFGQTITLSTKLVSTAAKTIPFTGTADVYNQSDELVAIGTLTTGGAFKVTLPSLSQGLYSYTIGYSGDANHTAETSNAFAVLVNFAPTTTTLVTSTGSLFAGQSLTLTAIVSSHSAPDVDRTGMVTFLDNGSAISGAVALTGAGTASFVDPNPSVGKQVYTVQYAGDTNFAGNTSAGKIVTVNKDKTAIALVSSAANPIIAHATFNLTATISVIEGIGAPTGEVEFFDGKTPIGTVTLSDGTATLEGISLAIPGTHNITADYSGDTLSDAVNSSRLMLTID